MLLSVVIVVAACCCLFVFVDVVRYRLVVFLGVCCDFSLVFAICWLLLVFVSVLMFMLLPLLAVLDPSTAKARTGGLGGALCYGARIFQKVR